MENLKTICPWHHPMLGHKNNLISGYFYYSENIFWLNKKKSTLSGSLHSSFGPILTWINWIFPFIDSNDPFHNVQRNISIFQINNKYLKYLDPSTLYHIILTRSWVIISEYILKYFFYMSQKKGFDTACKLSLHEMPKPIFWEKQDKYYQFVLCWSGPESG